MATAPTYITHRQLKDIFPQVNSFDSKRPLFSFTEQDSSSTFANSVDVYQHSNSGLATALYRDGNDLDSGKQTIGTTKITDANEVLDTTETDLTVIDGSECTENTYIKLDDEVMYISGISTHVLTVVRARLGTAASTHVDGTDVFQHFSPTADGQWLYDSDNDFVVMAVTDATNPSDNLMETGEDFSTLITRTTANASRYFDSRVDPSLPKNQLKDKSGNYDYMVIRTVGLIAASFMIKTKDHNSEVAISFMEEAEKNIELLNEGKAALSWQNTADAPQGTIRDVSYTDGSVRPVDTRGSWSGTFDLIRVMIVTGGAMDGTATYSVWVKDGDKLGNQQGSQVVTAEKINGDYQALAGGLQIRFGGETKTSVATATNEWEVEVTGSGEYVDSSDMKSIKLTRSGSPARRYYK